MPARTLTTTVWDDLALDGKARALLNALIDGKNAGLGAEQRLVLCLDEPTDWWSLSVHASGAVTSVDLAEGHGIASLLDAFCAIHNIEMVDL